MRWSVVWSEAGKLRASLEIEPAEAFIIAVPTPLRGHGAKATPDISYVEPAANTVAPVLRPGNLVILESTSPVGTTERHGSALWPSFAPT